MTCARCKDTGSLSGQIDDYVDCPCEAGVERAGFNAWATINVPSFDLVDAWICFQYGKGKEYAKENEV